MPPYDDPRQSRYFLSRIDDTLQISNKVLRSIYSCALLNLHKTESVLGKISEIQQHYVSKSFGYCSLSSSLTLCSMQREREKGGMEQ
jgi:hypothetical protein